LGQKRAEKVRDEGRSRVFKERPGGDLSGGENQILVGAGYSRPGRKRRKKKISLGVVSREKGEGS